MTKATLTFLGAARGVTGSCYHLAVDDAAILIDCGTFQGDAEADSKNRQIPNVSLQDVIGCIYTHGHLDHVGRLPAWVPQGFRGTVWGHSATLDIAKIILEDSAKIANHSAAEPLYGDQEVAQVVQNMRPFAGYRRPLVAGPFTMMLFDAGHILGSSSVRVAWQHNGTEKAVLFSGDVGVVGSPLIADPNSQWDNIGDAVDFVVTESTYGNRTHPPRAEVRKNLHQVVSRALQDGGKVIIPAFSIGRTQEIIYELHRMVGRGELHGIPIIVDGPLGLSATNIYAKYTECYDQDAMALLRSGHPPLEFDSLFGVRDAQQSRQAVDTKGPAIIIAGSGMCQGGRIRHYLKRYLPDDTADVLLVGYQAKRTLGSALQQGDKRVFIDDQPLTVRARITTISGLSAHADKDGLANWYGAIPKRPSIHTFVTHGEEAQSLAFASLLTDRFGVVATAPALYQAVEL